MINISEDSKRLFGDKTLYALSIVAPKDTRPTYSFFVVAESEEDARNQAHFSPLFANHVGPCAINVWEANPDMILALKNVQEKLAGLIWWKLILWNLLKAKTKL